MRKKAKSLIVGGLMFCGITPAFAQGIPAQTVSNNAGRSAAEGVQIFGNTGLGMAVGTATADGVIVHHGFLVGGRVVAIDKVPPTFDPAPGNIAKVTDAGRCATVVTMPDINVTDERDIAPVVEMVVQTNPAQQVEPGQELLLARGSYDVIVTATDRSDNAAQTSFRIDVVDETPPQIVEVPNPTPFDQPAEATSPLGTPVDIAWRCSDTCDENPTVERMPDQGRFPLGLTEVEIACVDADGNRDTADVGIWVGDTTAPRTAGALPNGLNVQCNTPEGARIEVPQVVWQDNAFATEDLSLSLVLNPGPQQQVFDAVPQFIDLLSGPNILRYQAVDGVDNAAHVDLRVDVDDTASPDIEVVSAPLNGWHGGDQPLRVVFELSDGCSQGQIDFEVQPPPTEISRRGNRVTVTYEDEGVYEMSVVATDADGNATRDNSVAFGIDRAPPAALLNAPAQLGVDPDDPDTHPIFAWSEDLALNVGGEDDADGQVSGIATVRVVIDPDTDQEQLIADHDFDLQGSPRRGPRVGRNVGCTVGAANGCNDSALSLRAFGVGSHVMAVTVIDAAGNSTTSQGYFRTADLHEGVNILRPRLLAMADEEDVLGPVAQRLSLAATLLGQIRDLTQARTAQTRWQSPRFLGAAIQSASTATIRLTQALQAAEGDRPDRISQSLDLLHRVTRSDITLMHAHTLSLDREAQPAYLTAGLAVDDELTNRALDFMGRDMAADQWTASMGNAQLAFFHAKSAYEQWLLDYHAEPDPADFVTILAEYGRGGELLQAISDEIGAYTQVAGAPGSQFMDRLRDRTQLAADRLTVLAENGFDVEGGLSDQAYIEALLQLRDAANFSAVAGNQGAWVRNYQWSMLQVVRFMTHASVRNAIFWRGGGRTNWPLYSAALGHIADGVEQLDARQVQATIDLYGENQEVGCLLISAYHCDFLDDEAEDQDQPIRDRDVPEACWDMMLRPQEWADHGNVQRPGQCLFGEEVAEIRGL